MARKHMSQIVFKVDKLGILKPEFSSNKKWNKQLPSRVKQKASKSKTFSVPFSLSLSPFLYEGHNDEILESMSHFR